MARPWCIVEHTESFEVQDAAGVHLAFVYFEDEPIRRGMMDRLTKDHAWILAERILAISTDG